MITCNLSFICPKTWNELTRTESDKTRYCDSCSQQVHWVDTQVDFDRAAADDKCVAFEAYGTPMLGFPDGVEQEPILRIEMQVLSAKQLYFLKYELYLTSTFNEIKQLHAVGSSEIVTDPRSMRELAQRLNELDIKNQMIVNEL
jgi:hypothetical protein